MTFWEQALVWLKSFGIKACFIAITIIVGLILIALTNKVLSKILKRADVDNAAASFIKSLIKALIWLLMLFVALMILGVSPTAIIAVISGSVIAIGLALQNSLSNLASGILIAVTKPFKEGDYVEIGTASGKIVDIRLFNTHLATTDNKRVIVPNNKITSDNIVNFTNQTERLLNMTIPVSYDSDLKKVKTVLLDILDKEELVIHSKPYLCEVHEYGQSCINFVLRGWARTDDYWTAYWSINEKIVNQFRLNNIEIPYNKLDVVVKRNDVIENNENLLNKKHKKFDNDNVILIEDMNKIQSNTDETNKKRALSNQSKAIAQASLDEEEIKRNLNNKTAVQNFIHSNKVKKHKNKTKTPANNSDNSDNSDNIENTKKD